MIDSYTHHNKAEELIPITCNKSEFRELARTHRWRESVIAILVREPFGGKPFQMGGYLVQLSKSYSEKRP